MANSNVVKWIKITTDIFDDEKFQIIDSMPEADAIELMWFKLLIFAGKSNNNGIFFFNDRVAYTDEMLASVFHRPLNVVRLALNTFKNLGMIEEIDGVYTIPNWEKHQTLDAYERKKQRDREYKALRREMQKNMIDDKKSSDKSSDSRLTVRRNCSYSYSIDNINNLDNLNNIHSDKPIDNNNNKNNIKNNNTYTEIIDYLNNKTGKKFSIKAKDTKRHINARLDDGFTIDDFKKVIDNKVKQWGNDKEMSKYLRPMTLFGTKFESYLNEGNSSNGYTEDDLKHLFDD